MVHSLQSCHPSRLAFGLPELLDIQRASFNKFLKQGISNLFAEITPIRVEQDNLVFNLVLDATNYQLISPNDSPRDCILKMKTYSCKLYVKAKVVCTALAGEEIGATKEEWVLVGHLPIMTKRGHFIINGSPRVIVHQVVRSPGVYFQQVLDFRRKALDSGDDNKRIRFYGDIIPFRGVWLRLQISKKGKIEAKFKKGKKVSAAMLQKCLQFIERNQISQSIKLTNFLQPNLASRDACRASADLLAKPATFSFFPGGKVPPSYKKALNFSNPIIFTKNKYRQSKTNIYYRQGRDSVLEGRSYLASQKYVPSLLRRKYGHVLPEQNTLLRKGPPASFAGRYILGSQNLSTSAKHQRWLALPGIFWQNLQQKEDSMKELPKKSVPFLAGQENKALLYTYNKLYRPVEDREKEEITKKGGRDSTFQSVQDFVFIDDRLKLKNCYKNLSSTFKERNRYTLSDLGREKINTKLGINVFETQLTALDIKATSHWLHKLTKGEKSVDDIDHFQNRRIRTSGELLQIQFENGIDRLKKFVWNKLKDFAHNNSTQNSETEFGKKINKDSLKSLPKIPQKFSLHHTSVKYATKRNQKISISKTPFFLEQVNQSVKGGSGYRRQTLLDKQEQSTFFRKALQRPVSTVFAKKGGTCFSEEGEGVVSTYTSTFSFGGLKDFFSTKPINGALRELFGGNPLSQYMDQTNPLAEITHKRRMSSLGVGGVTRESAGMAIRGIHPTHYGRICPIETPEGKNAGLVNSLAFFSKINNKGFIETPYYKVVKGQVQEELGFTFYSAKRESVSQLNIAPSDLQQSCNKKITTNSVPVRVADNLLDLFQKIRSDDVKCIGVSPIQMISVATSLIPFLEHNDANRALMGSNMQRQAVPLMIPERPIVGTGLESRVVTESGHLHQAELTGFVSYVSASKIVIESLAFLNKKTVNSDSTIYAKETKKKVKSLPFFSSLSEKRGVMNILGTAYVPGRRKVAGLNSYKASRKKELRSDSSGGRFLDKQLFFFYKKTNNMSFIASNIKEVKRGFRSTFLSKLIEPANRSLKIEDFSTGSEEIKYYSSKSQLSKISQFRFQENLPSAHLIHNFDRSNQDTCLMQRVSLKEGDWVQRGDIITDCSASDKGELSVGKNILVAYMPWEGYNFEDAIVINERLVKEQVYTSLHIERYDFNAQGIKEGNEWFTKDLPGISPKKVKHLDEFGLPKIGTFVQEGDILIGKMRYSNKKPTTPYEKLLCDILGENNFSARDSSLYVPKGVHARVIKHRILAFFQNASQAGPYNALPVKEGRAPSFTGRCFAPERSASEGRHFVPARSAFRRTGNNFKKSLNQQDRPDKNKFSPIISRFRKKNAQQSSKLTESDKKILPKIVHIFLGEKRAIQIGDKMSGRHGNKGVVATILPKQDMPYLPDGTPIDIVLNPLGVPSRMNVGQLFESLLGLAGTYLEQHFKMTAFDELYGVEASQSLVFLKLYQARLQSGQNWLFQVDFPGKTRLIDGRSGQCFDQWVTVGRAYILKLIHMVHEKIHARATGPYALITQQPLRGRSQKGGQRLGEMEVWALQGFGAAYTLQELLTKKSDDIVGRKEVASAILPRPFSVFDKIQLFNKKQENRLMLGQPEIFKVLICELQALCLDVGVFSLTTKSFQRTFFEKVH